jgi:Fic family protein
MKGHIMLDVKTLYEDFIKEKEMQYRKGIYGYTQRTLAYNSNKIEGSTLTPDQTAALFDEGILPQTDDYYRAKDIEEMNGHFMMFNKMLSTMDEPLSHKLIKAFHFELKSGVFEDRANNYAIGDYKRRANMVGTYKTALPSEVTVKMDELLTWYNSTDKSLEDIVRFHLRYEAIHPFQDGNGRTGRLIVFRECLKNNIFPIIIEDIHRREYISAFAAYQTNGSIDGMLKIFEIEQKNYMAQCEYFYQV